eukprot:9987460-Alexandrium_andersonii.AAC.1
MALLSPRGLREPEELQSTNPAKRPNVANLAEDDAHASEHASRPSNLNQTRHSVARHPHPMHT